MIIHRLRVIIFRRNSRPRSSLGTTPLIAWTATTCALLFSITLLSASFLWLPASLKCLVWPGLALPCLRPTSALVSFWHGRAASGLSLTSPPVRLPRIAIAAVPPQPLGTLLVKSSQELLLRYIEQDAKQGPSSQFAERAGSGLEAFSSSKGPCGLSARAQVRV